MIGRRPIRSERRPQIGAKMNCISENDVETIATVTGREVRIDRQEGQKGDMRDTLADTAQAARDLGFIPKTPLATGLKAEWEWICS